MYIELWLSYIYVYIYITDAGQPRLGVPRHAIALTSCDASQTLDNRDYNMLRNKAVYVLAYVYRIMAQQ